MIVEKKTGWREYLKITVGPNGWSSEYRSVNNLLLYLQMERSNSQSTKIRTCVLLHKFCDVTGKNPDELVELDKATLEHLVNDFAAAQMSRTNWGKTANMTVTILKYFFRENGFRRESGRELICSRFHVAIREQKRGEYVPTPTEAIKMANTCGIGTRDYAIILLLAFSGLRNSTLRALRYCDIKDELAEGKENLLIHISKEMKKIVPNAAKGGIPYNVFTTKLTTEGLRLYINGRIRVYKQIPDDAALFSSRYNRISGEKRNLVIITDRELQVIVKKAAMRAEIKQWKLVTPHKLRKTFDRFLRDQPSEARLDPKDQEYFMGHILPGSADKYYVANIEEMRTKFSKLVVERDPTFQTTREMARDVGIDPDAAKIELAIRLGREPSLSEDMDYLRKRIKEKVETGKSHIRIVTKSVDEAEANQFFRDGWEFKGIFPSGKIVVSREEPQAQPKPEAEESPRNPSPPGANKPADKLPATVIQSEISPPAAISEDQPAHLQEKTTESSGDSSMVHTSKRAQIAKLLLEGKSRSEIAVEFGVSESYIYEVRKVKGQDGTFRNGRDRTKEELEQLMKERVTRKSGTSGWSILKTKYSNVAAIDAKLNQPGLTESYKKILGDLRRYWEKREI